MSNKNPIEIYTCPWPDFLDSRLRLVQEWARDGESPGSIAERLNQHTKRQVERLLKLDASIPVEGSLRWRILSCR